MSPLQGWNPPELPPKRGKSVHVVKAGNLVYVAGQTAEDIDGSVVGIGDPDAQARKAYTGVATAVRAAGGTPDDIVHLTMYVTDRDNLPAIRGGNARQETLGDIMTTTTLVVVSGLARPEFLIEIEAIAYVDS